MIRSALLFALAAAAPLASVYAASTPAPAQAAASALSTVAERSGFVRTGRYDEVIALCAQFQKGLSQGGALF